MSATPTRLVCANLRYFPGALCRVFINDIPVLQGYNGNDFSHNTPINHFLVKGENTLAVEILDAPDPIDGRLHYEPDPRPQMNGKDLNQSVEVAVFKGVLDEAGAPTGELNMLYHCRFPDLWQHVQPERRRLPYMHVATFDPAESVSELTFLSATPEVVPCEGTKELHEAVRELHRAFVDQSASDLTRLMNLQMSEYQRAHGGRSGASMGDQISALDDLVSEPLVVAPLDWGQMHFHARAGGRIVHVERVDHKPVFDIKTIGKPQGHASDPVFTRKDGRWQLM